jgi:hypothetical protein
MGMCFCKAHAEDRAREHVAVARLADGVVDLRHDGWVLCEVHGFEDAHGLWV